MKNSFPEKTDAALKALEKKFYHHFSDYIVETIKLADISLAELKKRAFMENPEVVDKLIDAGHNCVALMMGHYGNWEWYTYSTHNFKDARLYQIYRPLRNKIFDRLFIYIRTRYDSSGIRKNDTMRDIIRLKRGGTKTTVVFLADQTPSKANLHYWTTFLNQDTSILTGTERLARKLDLPVVFLDVQKVKRGYYKMDMQLITSEPNSHPEFWITEEYKRRLEKMILREPAYWLWTHKRWKFKKSDSPEQ